MGRCIAFPFRGAKGDEIRRQLMVVRGMEEGGGQKTQNGMMRPSSVLAGGHQKGTLGVDFMDVS